MNSQIKTPVIITDNTPQSTIFLKVGLSDDFLSGKVLLASSKVTGANQDVVRCMFIQNRPDAVRPGQSNNSLLSVSMGWNSAGRMLRCWHNFDRKIFEQIGASDMNDSDKPSTADEMFAKAFELTDTALDISEGIGISIVENNTPVTWVDSLTGEPRTQAPLINPQTRNEITSGGKAVYAHTELSIGKFVKTVILDLDKVAATS